jgi:hypothetical protein
MSTATMALTQRTVALRVASRCECWDAAGINHPPKRGRGLQEAWPSEHRQSQARPGGTVRVTQCQWPSASESGSLESRRRGLPPCQTVTGACRGVAIPPGPQCGPSRSRRRPKAAPTEGLFALYDTSSTGHLRHCQCGRWLIKGSTPGPASESWSYNSLIFIDRGPPQWRSCASRHRVMVYQPSLLSSST